MDDPSEEQVDMEQSSGGTTTQAPPEPAHPQARMISTRMHAADGVRGPVYIVHAPDVAPPDTAPECAPDCWCSR
jgi:hypothetical protein